MRSIESKRIFTSKSKSLSVGGQTVRKDKAMAKWIEIDYEYNGETASIAELGYEVAICRLESLTSAGAKIIRVEEQRGA